MAEDIGHTGRGVTNVGEKYQYQYQYLPSAVKPYSQWIIEYHVQHTGNAVSD